MFRKRVSAKQITTTDKDGKTQGRLLLSKSSVKTFKLHNTSGKDRKNQLSKNSRIPGENEERSLLDVGIPKKQQHQSFEIEPKRSSDMRKLVRPVRLFSTPIRMDLENTKRRGVYYTDQSKKLRRRSETELMTREGMSKMHHEKLLKSENHFFSVSNIETHEDNKHSEDGVHKEDLNNSNLYKDKTFADNFLPRSSSQHEPEFSFCSPPQSQIVTLSQILANRPGAPRALFREKSNSYAPSPFNLRKQAHLSSNELDDTSMEKESSENDERNFAFDLSGKLEF